MNIMKIKQRARETSKGLLQERSDPQILFIFLTVVTLDIRELVVDREHSESTILNLKKESTCVYEM